ncbi:MAG TPA: class I SAM-dependent methyltransferase [archaeon]|nr:class I SAM-dependent methyltransferase [archaeon]
MVDQHKYLSNGDYEKFLRNIPEAYLELFHKEEVFFRDNVRRGAHVLDLGCGEARTTIPLAVHVGPEGKVIGIDNNERMCRLAKKKTEVLKNVEIYKLDVRNVYDLPRYEKFNNILFPFDLLGLIPPEEQVDVLTRVKGLLELYGHGNILGTVFSENAAPYQMITYQSIWPQGGIRSDKDFVYVDSINYKAERFSKDKLKRILKKADLKVEIRNLTKMAYSFSARR